MGTLIYDGRCGFCTTCARWAESRGIGIEAGHDLTKVVWRDGLGHEVNGHVAIARMLLELSGPYRIVGRILLTPPFSWFAWIGYGLVSRYRYKLAWFGRYLERHTQR